LKPISKKQSKKDGMYLKTKELVDKYYKIIVDHFDELLDVDHEKLIMVFSKPPYDDFSYKRDDELIWCQRIFIDL